MLTVVIQWISLVDLSLTFTCLQFDLYSLEIDTIRSDLSRLVNVINAISDRKCILGHHLCHHCDVNILVLALFFLPGCTTSTMHLGHFPDQGHIPTVLGLYTIVFLVFGFLSLPSTGKITYASWNIPLARYFFLSHLLQSSLPCQPVFPSSYKSSPSWS